MLLRMMGFSAADLEEVVWDESVCRPSPLSVACIGLHTADLTGDAEAVAAALDSLAERLGAATELVRATHEKVSRLRDGMSQTVAPPRGLFGACLRGKPPSPPPPPSFSWWGSRAQEMFLMAVRTGLRREVAGDDVPVPLVLLQLLAPTPLTPLPRTARGVDVLALAGDWCRANAPRFGDIATKVGLRVAGKVLTRRRLLRFVSQG